MNAKQIWQTAKDRIQPKVNASIFTTWFQGAEALSFENGIFSIQVPTTFAVSYLEGHYVDLMQTTLSELTGSPVEIRFVVTKESSDQAAPESLPPSVAKRPSRVSRGRATSAHPAKPIAENISWLTLPDPPVSANLSAPAASPVAHRSAKGDGYEPDEYQEQPEQRLHRQPGHLPLTGEGLLNNRYTFSTFIVGKSNQLAHAASLAVSENPGRIYNPLFLYGGVGLGKTHLLHAVGHVGEAAGLNVLYVTSEKFTNEIINAIRFQKTEEFRTKYRQIDILLVDDIQFIAGKESTEEEFFHTFNTLYDANKQIMVTSDRPPKAIHSLQDRLRSRFEWGLLADIQPPEYEHRLAILRSKAESLRFAIPASVMEYIARPDCASVRELEGALNRVIAYATLHDAPLSVNLAAQALEHIYNDSKPVSTLTITEVLESVCRYYNVDAERIRGKQRDREIVWPRQVAMYIMREETDASLFQIGMELGGRDHTTIMHGWEKVHSEVTSNDRVRREIAAVLESLHR